MVVLEGPDAVHLVGPAERQDEIVRCLPADQQPFEFGLVVGQSVLAEHPQRVALEAEEQVGPKISSLT